MGGALGWGLCEPFHAGADKWIVEFTYPCRNQRAVCLRVHSSSACSWSLAACDRPGEKLAGELFEIDPGICGLPANQFVG